MAAQPPGPGFPTQAPSVMIWIFFTLEFVFERPSVILRDSGGFRFVGGCRLGLESTIGAEKRVYKIQNLTGFPRMVDIRAQPRALPDAVREVSGKLFHLAGRIPLRARGCNSTACRPQSSARRAMFTVTSS